MEDVRSKEDSQSTSLINSPSENSRFLDELSVANQLMALAETPELFITPESSSIQCSVESEETVPTAQVFLEDKSAIDLRNVKDPPEPETLEELIQMEHSYAVSYICQDYFEENEQLASETLQERDPLNQLAIPSIGTQVECDAKSLSKIMTVNILKEGKKEESVVCDDIYQNESDIPHINADENKYGFQRKLRIILKDCQTDISLSEHYNLRNKMTLSSANSDKIQKKTRFSCDSNDTIVTLQQPIKKRKIMQHNKLEDSEYTLKNAKLQSTPKSKNKEMKSGNFEAENMEIKTESLTDNLFNITLRSVETNATNENTNSKHQFKLQELKIKTTKLLPVSNKSRKSIENIDNTPVEKRRMVVIDSKSSTPEKKDSFDSREVIQLSPIITKCNKKKTVKREMSRFVVNKDEPPLFSQPDMMIKIGTDESSKKEIKDNEMSSEPEKVFELKDISVSFSKADDYKNNDVVIFSDNSTIIAETESNNLKLEASEESKILKETLHEECNDFKHKNSSSIKNEECVNEKNTLNLSIDIPLQKNNDSEVLCQDMVDEKNQKDTENLSDIKFQSNTDAEIKPGRKSSRLIKKKEFFEFVSEPTIAAKKKINAQKQKKGKSEKNKNFSEIDENEDETEEEEDDPDKLWCICRKPHNNRFMIQCDTCEDWFHGTCVGVTKQQGVQLEKQEKEWICPSCRSKDPQNQENPMEILQKPIINKCVKNLKRKESEKDITDKNISCNNIKHFGGSYNVNNDIKPTVSSLERHQKCEISPLERHQKYQRSPLEMHQKNQISHLERHLKSQSSPMEKHQKNQTTNCENATDKKLKATQKKLQDKINVLSKKSNKEFDKAFLSKNVSPKQHSKVLPISKMLFSGDSKKIVKKENKSSKDTLSLSIGKKPQQNSKSKEIKTVQKHRHNCIQCLKIAVANSCYCSSECIEKHVMQCIKAMREAGGSSKVQDWDSQRLVVFDRYKGNVITGEKGPKAGEIISWLKENPSFMIACSSSSISGSKKDPNCKKECDSSSNTEKATSKVNDVRMNVKKTLKNILMDRCKNSGDIILPEEEIRKIAVKIEEELYAQFKDTNLKYRTKYRSLMFNIKDPRNQGLFRKILRGEIAPDQVVHMTATELASVELSKWREQEMQHHLDMIKRVQLEQQKSGSLLKKTHKGEVEIEDDVTIIEQDVLKAVPKSDIDESFDVDKEDTVNDTTQLHRSHLFDLNCKICTGKVVPPPDESAPKKVRIAHSISVDASSPNTADLVSRVVEKKSPSSTQDDSLDQEPTSTVSFESPNIDEEGCQIKESKSATSVWKGFIFMQDIAKFVTSAYKVSGQTDRLHSDLPDTIQVCGRIIPDQVWDYISKIKQSGNKELIIIQFQAANDEEAMTYNTFYSYLNSRKRYGVVSNYSRKIKDFYIVPLAATSPVPTVLMPFDGPGLPSPRQHLLLGVIVRHKAKQVPQICVPKNAVSNDNELGEGSYTPPFEPRSYTPPLPASDEQLFEVESECSSSSNLNNNCYETKPSFLLCENKGKKILNFEISPLLKKENEVSELPKEQEENKPYDPEQDILILSAEECSRKKENLEEHKKILDALTKQVEETDREVSALKHYASIPKSSKGGQRSINDNINSVVESGMTTFLDIPENLQEILNIVRLKSGDSELKGDVDMRVNNSYTNKLSFGDEVKKAEEKATPPPEEFEKPYPSDPRIKLRTPYQEPSFKPPVTQDEVSTTTKKNSDKNTIPQSTTSIPVRLVPSNWNQFREPPPPGIEPSELLIADIFQTKPDDSVLHPAPPHFVSSSVVQDKCCPSFPPPTVSYQTQSVFPNIVQPAYAQPPPLPIQTSPSKGNVGQWSSGYQPKKEWNEAQWSYSADMSSGYRRKQTNKHWERRYDRGQGIRRSLRGHKFENKQGNTYRKNHRN